MSLRRNKVNIQQVTESERGKNVGLLEGGFSYLSIGARVQRNSSTVMRFWKQLTDEQRTTRKTGSVRRKVMSARDDRHLLCMTVNDRTASFRQLAACWSTATDESYFYLWDHDGHIRVSRYASGRCLPECVIDLHSGLTSGVMPEVVHFLQGIPRAIFQKDNARPHVAKTVRDFCSAQHMQPFPWPAYSPDRSPILHVWDLVGRRLARDLRPAASKDELLLCIQAMWNSLPQAGIQNLFHSMPRRIADSSNSSIPEFPVIPPKILFRHDRLTLNPTHTYTEAFV
ncbi:transposable element Tcb2 transposase [Trichonephila clavipes]|nr:transposable element Tcb2 transposase [Trichonephila clavipes]